MHMMNTVCEGLEDLANVRMDTTDQHVDASDSRVKGLEILINLWSGSYHMILFVVQKIMSTASGHYRRR